MGFRSTFTTESYYIITWPQWFRDKYCDRIWFTGNNSGPLHSIREEKTYTIWNDLHEDIRRAINWRLFTGSFVLVYLHECGGITRCQIKEHSITWSEPDTWCTTEGITHNYCYGCSDS